MPKIRQSDVLERLDLTPAEYFVVSCHREENVDEPRSLKGFVRMLNSLAEDYKLRMVVSTHPRTRKRLNELKLELRQEVELREPLGFCDFVQLELNAKATLSDSGTITEEASILGFAALNLREAHERPEGMEEGSVMMTGFDVQRVKECLRILAHQPYTKLRVVQDYLSPNVSDKVVRIIQSYVNYVNLTVWRKSVEPPGL
jgi:UDP-N-acetyl-L-fucosamine synthase